MPTTKIPGPAGLLEADCSPGKGDAWAILCHPHPLYGGSMDDAVIDVAQTRFQASGGGTVAFNFRGVGSSEGCHDGGTGEVDDVLAVADWLESNYTVDTLTLIGYSFGSSVAWRALPRLPRHPPAILVAPPFGSMGLPADSGGRRRCHRRRPRPVRRQRSPRAMASLPPRHAAHRHRCCRPLLCRRTQRSHGRLR